MIRLFQQHIPKRRLLLLGSEALLLMTTMFLGASIPGISTRSLGDSTPVQVWRGVLSAFLIALLAQISLSFNDLYDWRVSQNRLDLPNRLLHAAGFCFITLAIIAFFAPSLVFFPTIPDMTGQTWKLAVLLGFAFLLLYYWRICFHWFFFKWRFGERLLILGTGPLARELAQEIKERPDLGFEIIGLMGNPPKDPEKLPVLYLGSPPQLPQVATEEKVSRVIVSMEDRRGQLPVDALLACRLEGVLVEEREAIFERIHGKLSLSSLRPSYLIFSKGFRKARLTLGIKRAFDAILAAAGLSATSPLLALIAILIRIDSKGNILFHQPRVGLDGHEFVVWKFRTMRAEAEKHTGPVWALSSDDRITRIGSVLRKTRLDELPQMWNILLGEMSFVGPRPERPFFVDQLRKEIPYYLERLTVRPGLTGWAQINYPYGASIEDAKEKLMYDLYYVKNMSLLFDLTILLKTIKVLLLRRGSR